MVYINDQYRFIFVENPKSGSTSVRDALQKVFKMYEPRELPNQAHLTCEQIKEVYPDKWKDYLKVTTYRDPYERFRSCMRYKEHFTYYCKNEEHLVNHFKNNEYCVYCKTQSEFTEGCDIILNLNNLQSDFDELCKQLNVQTTKVMYKNTESSQSYSYYLSDELLKKYFKGE